MRTTEAEQGRAERRQRAAAEIRNMLTDLYRGFVSWASVYGDVDGRYEQDQRKRVAGLLDWLSNGYLARSMWLHSGARKRVEDFIEKSENSTRGSARRSRSEATRRSGPAWRTASASSLGPSEKTPNPS